jgi:hypothetical protein
VTGTARRNRLAIAYDLLRKAVVYEIGMWRSLFRMIARRPAVAPGGHGFGYASAILPILWAFIVLSAIEIPVFHLLIPWPTVQIIGLILGAYGLLWMIGLLASLKVYPHVVEESGLRVRYSSTIDIPIPWSDIVEIRRKSRTLEKGRTAQVEETADGRVLSIAISNQTDIELDLREPRVIQLFRGPTEPVNELRFFVDDQKAFLAQVRRHQAAALS